MGRFDWLVSSVALAGLAVSVAFLVGDGSLGPAKLDELQPIARAVWVSEDVRRRLERDVVWISLPSDSDVYSGDSVFTGDASETRIAFRDGSEVFVEPKSLVVIRESGGEGVLDIQVGSISGRIGAAGRIRVLHQGRESSVSGGKGSAFQVTAERGKAAVVRALAGKLALEAAGERSGLEPGEAARVEPPGEAGAPRIQIARDAIVPVAPAHGEWFANDDGPPIDFEWKRRGGSRMGRVEVSRESTFRALEWSAIAPDGRVALTKALPSGTYFWRVVAGDETSHPWRFGTVASVRPELSLPREGAIARAGGQFSWKDDWGSSPYEVEISADAKFSEIAFRLLSSTRTALFPILPPGGYYWRVRSNGAKKGGGVSEGKWSLPWGFLVPGSRGLAESDASSSAPPALATPAPSSPPSSSPLPATQNRATTELRAPVLDSPAPLRVYGDQETVLRLAWKPVAGVDSYRVELATDRAFRRKAFAVSTREARLEWKTDFDGNSLFARARSSAGERLSGWSLPVEVRFDRTDALARPDRLTPDDTDIPAKALQAEVVLSWKAIAQAPGYLVLVWSGKTRFSRFTRGNSLRVAIESGRDYFWQVTPAASEGDERKPAEDSTPRVRAVGLVSKIAKFTLLAPNE